MMENINKKNKEKEIQNKEKEIQNDNNNDDESIEFLKEIIEKLKKENEKLLRNLARVENEKKLLIKETDRKIEMANEKLLKDMIKVLDAIRSASKVNVEDECNGCVDGFIDGIKIIDNIFHDILKENGIEKIECDKFDPNFHQAVQIVNKEDLEDGEIVEVLQEGYKLNDKIIRPSMVIVNKKQND